MRVVQVNTSDAGGGAEVAARSLHVALRARGHDAELLVGTRRTEVAGVVEIPPAGHVDALRSRLQARGRPRAARAVRVAGDPRVVTDLLRGREDFRFPATAHVVGRAREADVVHLHNLHGAYFDLRLLPEVAGAAPVVLTLHDEWLLTGHCAMTFGCDRWRTGCGSCPHLDTYPRLRRDGTRGNVVRKRGLAEQLSLDLVAPAAWLLDRAAASAIAPAVRTARVIPNGVDLDRFSPGDRTAERRRLGLDPAALVVVFSATAIRTNPAKDYATLDRALTALGETEGAPVIALGIGDEGETERRGRLELRWAGRLPHDEVVSALRAADVYVHATRADVAPLAVIEALATGIPVVATRLGGIPELVDVPGGDADATGLLVPEGDARALARAVGELGADPDRRAAMAVAAVAAARRRFSLDATVDAYVEAYEAALSSRGAS